MKNSPGRCVERLLVERESRTAGEHDVDLLVPERAFRVLLEDVVTRPRCNVGVDPECSDVERSPHRAPQERSVHDRNRLNLVEVDALPAVWHQLRALTETGDA